MTRWTFLVAVVASLGLGCGSGSSGGTGGSGGSGGTGQKHHDAGHDSGPTAAAACKDYATNLCSLINSCSKIAIQSRFGSLSACVTNETEVCSNSLAAPSTGDTADVRDTCAKALSSWACSDFLNGQNPPSACAPVAGKAKEGAACAFSSQCQTGFCAIQPKSACGTCAAAPATGDSCAHLSNCGTSGLNCVQSTNTCEAPVASGGACGLMTPCAIGTTCVGADAKTMTMGICTATATMMGATCDPTFKSGPLCASSEGLVCNAAMKTCQTLTIAAPGAACGTTTGQLVICGNGANCTAKPGPKMGGTCAAEIPDKGACQLVADTGPCPPNERCIVPGEAGVNGTCQFNNAAACK